MFLAYREKPGKYGLFVFGFPCFSRLFGYRILRFPRNHGILESWESIPGFSRFFIQEKPGKRGIIIPDSPCFSRLFGLVFHTFQEIVESLKARKAGNIYSWLSTLFQAFQVGIPCFPRNGGILESWESFLPFCAFLHIGESQESAEHFFLAFQASPGFWE